jgi:hypothetical protein
MWDIFVLASFKSFAHIALRGHVAYEKGQLSSSALFLPKDSRQVRRRWLPCACGETEERKAI